MNWRTEYATQLETNLTYRIRHTIDFLNRFEIKTPYSLQTTVKSDTAMRQNVDLYHRIDLPILFVISNGEMQDVLQNKPEKIHGGGGSSNNNIRHFDVAKTAKTAKTPYNRLSDRL